VLTICRPFVITAPTCRRQQVLRVAAIMAIAMKSVSQSGLSCIGPLIFTAKSPFTFTHSA
jgi:hypothetical protein